MSKKVGIIGSTLALRARTEAAAQLTVHASVVTGPDSGTSVSATGRPIVIGRSSTADLRLTDHTVSMLHVELVGTDRGIVVRDLQSLNGVAYSGGWIERATLPHGAVLQVGSTSIRLEMGAGGSESSEGADAFGKLKSQSGAMRSLFALLNRIARTDMPVLLEGRPGSDFELLARGIHDASGRAANNFVIVDCATLAGPIAQPLLFGEEAEGEVRPGFLESAGEGTLFLDQIDVLSAETQEVLAGVLVAKSFNRVGGEEVTFKARVVAASSEDLRVSVNTERFREDLYEQVAQVRARIPSLRERSEDIMTLVYQALQRIPADVPAARSVSREAVAELRRREFALDVRGLFETVERAALLASGSVLTPDDLAVERLAQGEASKSKGGMAGTAKAALAFDAPPSKPAPSASAVIGGQNDELPVFRDAKRTVVDGFEKAYLERLLQRSGQNLSRASIVSGIERSHLRDLLRKHGLRDAKE